MTLAIHQNTSSGAGYRGSLEGWAKAGIRHVEITNALVSGSNQIEIIVYNTAANALAVASGSRIA